jgi:DNA-binding NtrC family response regulator
LLLDVIPDMGFAATAARSAEEARKIMQSELHDILLLDLRLPGVGGLEFFEQVREEWPETQVIIMTGHGELEAATRAIHLDVVDFLTKPCQLANIEIALDRARRRISSIPTDPSGKAEVPAPATNSNNSTVLTLEDSERQQILTALARNNGNRTAAAVELGISRRMLHYRLSEYQKQGHLHQADQ